MGILRMESANALFLPAWNAAQERAKRNMPPDDDRRRAMAAFGKAMRDCDKAMEDVMDRHHESVAESAKKREAYRKKRAQQERVQRAADELRTLNREAVLQAQARRDWMQEMRMEADARTERFDLRA